MGDKVIRWLRRNWLPILIFVAVGVYWAGGRELRGAQEPPPLDESVPVRASFTANGAELVPGIGAPTERPRLVDFYTDQCPACRAVKPAVERLSEECAGGDLDVVMVNLSDERNMHLAARYRVVGVPTLSVLDPSGDEVGRMVGVVSHRALRRAVDRVAGVRCVD
jgi:thiol-disulfide isomerase/thioredoxin